MRELKERIDGVNRRRIGRLIVTSKYRLIFIGASALFLFCVTLAVGAYGRREPVAVTQPVAPVAVAQPSSHVAVRPPDKPRVRVETEIITILPHGFDHSEIARSKGEFVLMVDNRSGIDDLLLRLDREAGDRLKEVQFRGEQIDWNDLLDLTPGTYVLSEANHPEWVCRITITGN